MDALMDFNTDLMLGFLIWSVFCLLMLLVERFRSRKWKRAANAMEVHARMLQNEINRRDQRLWDSVPKGVITHDKKQR